MTRAILSFLVQLLRHKWYVFVAGVRLGGIPVWRLVVHDLSKLSPVEFIGYVRHFHLMGKKAERGDRTFAYAWLHHENHGPHHWGYWIPRSGRYAGRPLPMPESYIREMVADWLGAGRTYTGSWDMSDWLNATLPGICTARHMAWETVERLSQVLSGQGYAAQAIHIPGMYARSRTEVTSATTL